MIERIKVGEHVIMNFFDRPCLRLVARVIEVTGSRVTGRYICEGYRQEYACAPDVEITPVSDFGIALEFDGGAVRAVQLGESSATYGDGSSRSWQPNPGDEWISLRAWVPEETA